MVAAGLQIQANIIWSTWFVIAVCLKINQHLKFQIWKSNTKSLCFIIYIHWLILEKAEFEEVNLEFYSFQNLHCSRIAHNLKVKKVNATHLRIPRTLPIIRFEISNMFFSLSCAQRRLPNKLIWFLAFVIHAFDFFLFFCFLTQSLHHYGWPESVWSSRWETL